MSAITAVTSLSGRELLKAVMRVDAAVTGANGVAYLALAGPLEDLLGLSSPLLRGAGAFLVVFALLVALAGTRVPLLVIGANIAWAAGSVVAAVAGWGSPDTAGTVWIVLQAITVGAFAELGLLARRRS